MQDLVVLNILTISISEVKLLSGKNGGKQKWYLYILKTFADRGKDGFVKSAEVVNFTASLAITEVDKVRKSKESFLVYGFNLHPCPQCDQLWVLHTITFVNWIPGALEMLPTTTC